MLQTRLMCRSALWCVQSRSLVVGVAQMNSGRTVAAATNRICEFLEESSRRGASICVFPEAAITASYDLPDCTVIFISFAMIDIGSYHTHAHKKRTDPRNNNN